MPQRSGPMTPSQPNGLERQARGIDQATVATKPLPRLPRSWSRVCHETGLFLRGIGLGVVVTALQGFFTKNFSEPEKAAIRQSRVTASLRALIHTIPLGLALFEIVLNWKGRFVGAHFDSQNYLQFVAKVHEIFMQASMATIVLSYTRYQVCVGKGMPFGAVLGALQFLQVSYLWSVELWSVIISKDFQLRKKIYFAFLILLCVTVAATAGPSSANLLIARQGTWSWQSQYLVVNATSQDLWPDQLDGENISSDCKTVNLSQHRIRPSCPTLSSEITVGGISSSWNGWKEMKNITLPYGGILLQTKESQAIKELAIGSCSPGFYSEICSTYPQVTIADGFIDANIGLIGSAMNNRSSDSALGFYHILKENYYQPYSVASCVADTVENSSDRAPLRFAHIPRTASEAKGAREIVSVSGLTKGQLIDNIEGNVSQVHVDWVDLPQDVFKTGVPAAVIVYPRLSRDSPYSITTCTLGAGWGSSKLMTDRTNPEEVKTSITKIPPSWYSQVRQDPYGIITASSPVFVNEPLLSYPQVRINISKSWMEFTNPTLILPNNSTVNLVTHLMSLLSFPLSESDTAYLFSILCSTALSDTGAKYDWKVFEDRAHISTFCETCLVFEIENFLYGWIYTTRETTTKLAIAIMLIYCSLALAHTLYSAISGLSSTAWDSVAEMLALAMNSSPTEALHNTCAGIVGKKVYQANVRVLKTSEKHLELVFGEINDPNADLSKLVLNEMYGGKVVVKENEDETLKIEMQGGMGKRAL